MIICLARLSLVHTIYFFIHGPKFMRRVLELPQADNFASIQTRLFMRYCATVEIKKATGQVPKKGPLDLVFLRSVRNQMRD